MQIELGLKTLLAARGWCRAAGVVATMGVMTILPLSAPAASEKAETKPPTRAASAEESLPNRRGWDLGPFVKTKQPVFSPTPDSRFQCPILGKEVRWEEQNVYNPAAVVRDGKVYLLYRADDKNPGLKWGRTCRIGLAASEGGVHFTRHPTPVLYPDNDEWKQYEWEKKGFTGDTTVANTLVPFKGQWLLYYGGADHVIGLATCAK